VLIFNTLTGIIQTTRRRETHRRRKMSVPFNNQDYTRLLKLAEAVKNQPERAEISIWISDRSNDGVCYTSLEIKGYLTPQTIGEILETVAPLPPTEQELQIQNDTYNAA
jgi:hypothetical protein